MTRLEQVDSGFEHGAHKPQSDVAHDAFTLTFLPWR